MDLEQLYRENYHIVYGYLLSLCGDRALAEDLASEAFLRGIRHIGSFQEGKISTWLCAIGRNLYLNEKRRRKRHAPLDERIPALLDLEQEALDRDLARRIQMQAEALPEPKRSLFFMRCNGLSFRDIADALGQKETWARVTWYRIKKEIRNELEGTI